MKVTTEELPVLSFGYHVMCVIGVSCICVLQIFCASQLRGLRFVFYIIPLYLCPIFSGGPMGEKSTGVHVCVCWGIQGPQHLPCKNWKVNWITIIAEERIPKSPHPLHPTRISAYTCLLYVKKFFSCLFYNVGFSFPHFPF